MAAQIPDVPSAPTTSFNNANGQVTISWTAPNNGGSVITSYTVTIAKFDNSSYIETASCDGTLSSVVSAQSCTMASSVINGSPYLVPWGSSVFAKVSARNLYGSSLTSSDAGNGAVIITIPNPPTTLNATSITTNTIQFSWVAPSDVGGSPIIDYAVWWDQGVASWQFRQTVTVNTHRSTGLTTGVTYSYYVLARNAFGFSVASAVGSWLVATAPSIP